MSVTLTDQAAEVVKELLEKKGKPEAALRFGVQGGGCSGFSYMLAIDDEIEEDDHIFPHNGVKVWSIPPACSMWMVVRLSTLTQ